MSNMEMSVDSNMNKTDISQHKFEVRHTYIHILVPIDMSFYVREPCFGTSGSVRPE